MVSYIGVSDIQRLVASMGAAAFIERLAAEIEADYRRWGEFEKSARLASHSKVGVIELMPTSDGQYYSFKYVNGHPKNTSEGLLTVTAFGVLADVHTGYPLLLSELTVTTALRTAAMSALAARWLARPDSRVMALIGNGAQSEFQALAFHHLLGIDRLRLFDTDPAATAKLRRHLRGTAGLQVEACASVAEAVRGYRGKIGFRNTVRLDADLHGKIEHRALPRRDIGLAVVDGDLVGDLWVLGPDAQDRAMGDHAVMALVGG